MSEEKKIFKSGFVSIVGRPNVGKSTLLNSILEQKIAIVSKIPQTTRNRIRGIYNDNDGQIIFIDTPGMHLGRDKLDDYMNQASFGTIDEVDCIIYLVDLSRRIGKEEEYIANKLKNVKIPLILGLNKVDLNKKRIPEYLEFFETVKGKKIQEIDNLSILPLSGEKGNNLDELISIIYQYLPEGPALYPTDAITDIPQRLAISEIIREKLFNLMMQEIPHSLGVVVEQIQPKKGKILNIKVLIFVERQTHKEMVIGKGGNNLKKVGTLAREELEPLVESKVFLEMFVRVEPNWRNNLELLKEVGYYDY